MITQDDKAAFDAACTVLGKATDEIMRLERTIEASEEALARARRRYEQARIEYICCQLRLRTAAITSLPGSKPTTVSIMGEDVHIRESIAALLYVHRTLHAVTCGFGHWYADASSPGSQTLLVDVGEHSVDDAFRFIKSLDGLPAKPRIIAMVWPNRAASFIESVDRIVEKPLGLTRLLDAIDAEGSSIEARAHQEPLS